MMETIIGWLYDAVSGALNFIIEKLLGSLSLDLNQFIQIFPVAVTFYKMFRVLGIGLIVIFSCYELFKFFAGPLSESKDTPGRILVRSGIAAFLVFFGGYFINWIVDIAKLPYDAFLQVDPADSAYTAYEFSASLTNILATIFGGLTGVNALSASGQLLISVLLVVIIGWNLLKLMIEIAERFLMVGLLAYVAPLTFATLSTQATSMIFNRYLQMFGGQCVLMTLSVWSLKLVISGLHSIETAGTSWPVAMILVLAMCRIAQRIDSYMQQLGIGVGTTGGSLLDELCNMARTAASLGRATGARERGSNNRDSVLGGTTDTAGNVTPNSSYGLLGGIKGAWNKGKEAFTSGKSAGDVAMAAGSGFGHGATDAFKSANANASTISKVAGASAKVVAASFGAKGLVNALNQRDAAKAGITKEAAGTAHANSEGKPILNDKARANGLNISDKKDGPVLTGSIPAMRDYIAANAGDANQKDLLQNSLAKGSPLVAEGVLDGPNDFTPGKNGNPAQDDVLASAMSSAFGNSMDDDIAAAGEQMKPLQELANDEKASPDEREWAKGELANRQTAIDNLSQVKSAMSGRAGGNHENGYLKNVATQSFGDGGRQITASVQDSAGRTVGAVSALNESAYERLNEAQQTGYVPVTSATGATWYMKADGGGEISNMAAGNFSSDDVQPFASPCAVDSSGDYPVYSDSDRGYVSETVAQKFQSKDAGEVITAANTVAADSFTSDDASAVMDSWENSGATINPKNVSAADDAPAVSSAYASEAAPSQQAASAIMGVTQKAFGGSEAFVEQVGAAFGDKTPGGFNPEHVKEAFDNFEKGDTSSAFTVSKVSVHNGQTQFTIHDKDWSHKVETCRDDSGKRSMKILESHKRNDNTKPHSGGGAGHGNNPKKRK